MDERATIETTDEFRAFARVIKRALGVVIAYWRQTLPAQHPYRHAAQMIVTYLERRYHV